MRLNECHGDSLPKHDQEAARPTTVRGLLRVRYSVGDPPTGVSSGRSSHTGSRSAPTRQISRLAAGWASAHATTASSDPQLEEKRRAPARTPSTRRPSRAGRRRRCRCPARAECTRAACPGRPPRANSRRNPQSCSAPLTRELSSPPAPASPAVHPGHGVGVTVELHDDGLGLAAPQTGLDESQFSRRIRREPMQHSTAHRL